MILLTNYIVYKMDNTGLNFFSREHMFSAPLLFRIKMGFGSTFPKGGKKLILIMVLKPIQ